MNAFASRGVDAGFGRMMKKPRLSKRPRTFIAALIGTWVAFMWLVNRYYKPDEATVWIWMGIRSDDRCGRDFGTDHVKVTTCGKGSCCSSHGWCGVSEDYCSVALGCQSDCWKVDADEQQRIDAKKGVHDEDDEGGAGHHRRYDDDDEHGGDHNYRYDDYPGSHHDRYRDRYGRGGGHHHSMDDDEGYRDYNHRYDEGAHEGHEGDDHDHGDPDHDDHEADDHHGEGHHDDHGHDPDHDHYAYGEHHDSGDHGEHHDHEEHEGKHHDDHDGGHHEDTHHDQGQREHEGKHLEGHEHRDDPLATD